MHKAYVDTALQRYIKTSGYTVKFLAAAVGMNPDKFRYYLRKPHRMKQDVIVKLAAALGVEPYHIIKLCEGGSK